MFPMPTQVFQCYLNLLPTLQYNICNRPSKTAGANETLPMVIGNHRKVCSEGGEEEMGSTVLNPGTSPYEKRLRFPKHPLSHSSIP